MLSIRTFSCVKPNKLHLQLRINFEGISAISTRKQKKRKKDETWFPSHTPLLTISIAETHIVEEVLLHPPIIRMVQMSFCTAIGDACTSVQ